MYIVAKLSILRKRKMRKDRPRKRSLTPWRRILLAMPVNKQLKNFVTFYGNQRFITGFTRARNWWLSWVQMNLVHIKPSYFPNQKIRRGQAIAQAVSRRLPTAAPRVRSQVKTCGIYGGQRPWRSSAVRRWLPTAAARVRVRAACGVCGGQSGTGEVLRFPLPIIPPISPLS
jgi:hypothetical protein